MKDLEYINKSGRRVLKFFPPDSLLIDLHFILTKNKILTRHMPYLLLEKRISGNHIVAVRLIDFYEKDGIVLLDVQELSNNRTNTMSWNMENTGDLWLWSLADFENLTGRVKHN